MTSRPPVKKRPRGAGYVTPVLRDGGWRFRARYPRGDGGDRTVGTFATEDEAHAALNAIEALRAQDYAALTGAISLGDYGEHWIEKLPDANRGAWRSTWRTVVRRAPFADWPIDSIRRPDVRTWAQGLLAVVSAQTRRPISRSTAKHALGLLRRACAAALDEELIATNPTDGVRLPRRDGAHVDSWTHLDLSEIDRLLALPALSSKARSAFAVAIYTGLRQGELAALRWEAVDFDEARPRLRVLGSWDGATKTERPRTVPLLPAARAALLAWWQERRRPKRGLVWPTVRGETHARGYDWGWGEIRDRHGVRFPGWRERAGITRRVRFHDLRHTCASHLVMGSWGRAWSLQEVRDVLGHTSIEVTQRYARLTPNALDAAAAATPGNPAGNPAAAKPAAKQKPREKQQQTMRGSNARPLAPEAKESLAIAPTCASTDGWRSEAWALVARIAAGGSASREEVRAAVAGALAEAGRLAALAGAVLDADDATLYARLTALAEAPTDSAAIARDRQETA